MAKCKECGTNVGCGCNLSKGLCAFCADQANKQINTETNADTKTN